MLSRNNSLDSYWEIKEAQWKRNIHLSKVESLGLMQFLTIHNEQCVADDGGKHIFKLACVINGAFGSIIYASLINYAD